MTLLRISTPEIVDTARGIIEGSRERFPKDLQSTRESLDLPIQHYTYHYPRNTPKRVNPRR